LSKFTDICFVGNLRVNYFSIFLTGDTFGEAWCSVELLICSSGGDTNFVDAFKRVGFYFSSSIVSSFLLGLLSFDSKLLEREAGSRLTESWWATGAFVLSLLIGADDFCFIKLNFSSISLTLKSNSKF